MESIPSTCFNVKDDSNNDQRKIFRAIKLKKASSKLFQMQVGKQQKIFSKRSALGDLLDERTKHYLDFIQPEEEAKTLEKGVACDC
jgi:hypothetical protein